MDDSQEFQEYQEYEEVCEEAGTPEEAAKDHSTDPGTVSEEVRKKANKYFFSKVAINALLMILGAVLIALFLTQMQRSTALYNQEISSKESLTEVIEVLESHSKNAEELITVFHDCNQDKADDLRELFTSGVFDSLAEADKNERTEVFRDVVERSGVDYLFIMSEKGDVLMSPDNRLTGKNLVDIGMLTKENLVVVAKGTAKESGEITPAREDNEYGYYYVYSVRVSHMGRKVILVLAADASSLDTQLAALNDVSSVLSQAAVTNDGFMFAVNKSDNSFLYYKNGSEDLTGKNVFEAGLSKEALKDGYVGVETINGIKYLCTSKNFNGNTVVCAVADTANIYSNDKYVLIWTITGFILVMLICLVYAVIVRNDFVRNSIETKKKIFRRDGKPDIIFDRSIFKKVMPLLTAGVLLIFAISFYTQTLLEISDTVDSANVALKEMSARYDQSNTNREFITEHYDNTFLSKARLISYIIEEDPAVLNNASGRYYSEYDEKGNRRFLTDDEGNRLKSVGASERLQELCDANNIDSVYVFDEDGHTIATNTANWFSVISHNEEDQSYPFNKVLDGSVDYYVQDRMQNDLGEENQYIGVTFNYYTKKNASGDTEYVPLRDYLQAGGDKKDLDGKAEGGITAHKGMLQIGLDSALTKTIMASTDVSAVLSSDMLGNGFVVLFDDSEDHLCVYSPNEASIGRPALDLGVSPKAFSGADYYGFSRINGIHYLQYYHYNDGYYVGAAVPKADMYNARTVIALITSLASLVLILILLLTVTLTTEEEEMLYAAMSEDGMSKGLNTAVFNIILPSGERTSTVQAAARWDNRHIPWSDRTPEQKLLFMIGMLSGILVLYVVLSVLGVRTVFGDGSIIQYILSGDWDRGRNIFAFSASAIAIITTAIGVSLCRIPVRIISSMLGTRSETIGHLLLSVLKYGGAIGVFFYCLYLIGVDSTSLLASAGILSLVIGLGAQSLIKDILAGIFIVFEGEFRVGDIVTIDGYRGKVMDIGLRTTKIMGIDGNIKIYNNSEISGVLNMTQATSFAMCQINIEYGQDIEYVEEVLKRELPAVKQAYPAIIEGPTLYGVTALEDSGVTMLIGAKCKEDDIFAVRRAMNREVLNIFYKNGIKVPFPHVTVMHKEEE